jgi:hypothetical protein
LESSEIHDNIEDKLQQASMLFSKAKVQVGVATCTYQLARLRQKPGYEQEFAESCKKAKLAFKALNHKLGQQLCRDLANGVAEKNMEKRLLLDLVLDNKVQLDLVTGKVIPATKPSATEEEVQKKSEPLESSFKVRKDLQGILRPPVGQNSFLKMAA